MTRFLLALYLGLLAAAVGGILLLGNAQPARALSAPASAPAAVATAQPDGIDFSGLQPYWDQLQLLGQPLAAGLAPALLVWLTVNAAVWANLIANDDAQGTKKRRLALGSGIVFGLYATLHALAAAGLPIGVLPVTLALLDGIIRGFASGIVAALAYEFGSALLSKAAK